MNMAGKNSRSVGNDWGWFKFNVQDYMAQSIGVPLDTLGASMHLKHFYWVRKGRPVTKEEARKVLKNPTDLDRLWAEVLEMEGLPPGEDVVVFPALLEQLEEKKRRDVLSQLGGIRSGITRRANSHTQEGAKGLQEETK